MDQESLLKNRKKKAVSKERLPQGRKSHKEKEQPPPVDTTKATVEDDETLLSVDADMPELSLPAYVLPEGEFEDPAPFAGNDSSKRRKKKDKE